MRVVDMVVVVVVVDVLYIGLSRTHSGKKVE